MAPTGIARGQRPCAAARRLLALLAVPVLLLGLTAGVAGASVIEDYARVIRSRHAGATFVQVDGCRQVEVFLSAMDGTFGSARRAGQQAGPGRRLLRRT